MKVTEASFSTRFKVGLFTLLGIALLFWVTVFVNDHPYWWRPCQLVNINVEDATGLKLKSGVRSLGLDIGFLKDVELAETHVNLSICITAPVEVLPSTRAYLRSEGFLGDKFVELKPVKYTGALRTSEASEGGGAAGESAKESSPKEPAARHSWLEKFGRELGIPAAWAADPVRTKKATQDREIPLGTDGQDMQQMVGKVNELVNEVSGLATSLKQSLNPEEMRKTMIQLNRTLENASQTLAPEGGLNRTAQRALAKLEDSIEQMRDLMTRVNQGKGSVGMLLNDPTYAEEIRNVIKNANKLLARASELRLIVDIGAEYLNAYSGGRGYGRLAIWPRKNRYYLLGISSDPRGMRFVSTTTTTAAGVSTVTETVQIDQSALLLTAMIGQLFFDQRLEVAVGAMHSDGMLSVGARLGPTGEENKLEIVDQLYTRVGGGGPDNRIYALYRPWGALYLKAGLESIRSVNGQVSASIGAGVQFDDEDIKLLFSLR